MPRSKNKNNSPIKKSQVCLGIFSATILPMDSTSKVILFFILCIACGLGIGALVSKTNLVQIPIAHTSSQPVVSDDQSSSTPVVAQTQDEIQTPVVTPITTTTPDATQPSVVVPPKPKPPACPVAPENEVDQWLAPVGPDYSVGDDYIPTHLVRVSNYVQAATSTMCLNASAAFRLQTMETAMKTQGLHIVVSSAYRPASYQETLRDNSEAKRNLVTNPYPLVALPGHSEHQLGMAVDIVAGPKYSLDDFINTPEYAWLQLHSWEYGFIQSYPIGSETITGYSTESWHYRYVGIDNATAIHNQGITMYQYLKNLAAQIKNPA